MGSGRSHTTAISVLATALLAAACGSRIDHEVLLSEAAGKITFSGPVEPGSGSNAAATAGNPDVPTAGAEGMGDPAAGTTAPPAPAVATTVPAPVGTKASTATAPAPRSPALPGPSAPAPVTAPPSGAAAPEPIPTPGAATAPAPAPGNGPAPACTGKEPPITLGSVSILSGPVGAVVKPMVKGAQVWVTHMNAKGGLRCRKINYLIADDGGDPSRHQALVRQQVEQNRVQAFLLMGAMLTGPSSVEYLTSKRIPVVGGDTSGDWYYQSPMLFPQSAFGTPQWEAASYAAGDVGRLVGKKKLGLMYCAEVNACTTISRVAKETMPKAGMELVYNAQISLTQPSYLSECQAARDAGVEVLWPTADASGVARVARSCASVNFHPQYFVHAANTNSSLADDPNLDGAMLMGPVNLWVNTTQAAMAEYDTAMRRFAPGVQPDGGTNAGWTAGKLLEKAVAQSPSTVLDPNGILEGLWTIKNDDLGGLTGALTFHRDQNATPVRCWWLAQAKDGKWSSPNDGKRGCV